MNRNQRGFAAVEILLVVTVAVLLGFVAFTTYNARKTAVNTDSATPAASTTAYKDTKALQAAETELDNANLDTDVQGDDLGAMEAELATF